MLDTITLTGDEADFVAAYVEVIHFTEFEEITGRELCPHFYRECVIDCLAFLVKFDCYMPIDDEVRERIAHCLWYERNGHGTGFWDWTRDSGVGGIHGHILDRMSAYAHAIGSADASYATELEGSVNDV